MKKVLLVEDNQEIRENMSEILEMSGYLVVTASDGKEGVALAMEHKPDVIVCDIMMPVLDGYGVLHMLNKNADTQDIPFIFLTAKAERAEIRKGMELGADDYITKPFTGTELLNAVETRLRKSEVLQKKLAQGMEGVADLMVTISGNDLLKKQIDESSVAQFRKKQIIYAEGNNPHKVFFIEKGKVKTYKTNENGKELITGLHSEGEFLGYVAMLENSTYKETAEALEETELTSIPRSEFEKLVSSNKEVMKKFIQLLANNVVEKEEQLLNIAYNSLRRKVADALLAIGKKYGKGSEVAPIDISRENLANIAGTAKESLIRTLSDFKDEKLIDIRQGDIVILNEKKLLNLAN